MKFAKVTKRVICLALIAMLLALTASPALAASKKNPHGAYVVATSSRDRLRVHNGSGDVIDYLKRGTVVSYVGQKNGWWYVKYRNGEGFVDRSYLWSVSNSATAKYVGVDNLWVRATPSGEETRMAKLKAGKKVSIIGQSGNWVKIKYKSYVGWVYSIYLRRVS